MKKGQITTFVVIGLVLLIIAGLFIYHSKTTTEVVPPENTMTHDFSSVLSSYQSYAEKCLKTIGANSFQLVFRNGGYIDPEKEGFVAINDFPTTGSALKISPDSDVIVPYWLEQLGSASCKNNCLISLHIPPLEKENSQGVKSIEERVEELVEEDIDDCLNTFNPGDDYNIIPISNSSVDIIIGDKQVTYKLLRKTKFVYSIDGSETTINEVTAQDNALVKELYETGKSILFQMELMNSSPLLARVTSTIINSFGSSKKSPIPPMYGQMDFSTSRPRTWMLDDVKKKLSKLLADNIPQIQVPGSKGETLFLDPNHYSQSIYNSPDFKPSLIFPYQEIIKDLSIDFIYLPNWDLDLKINPSNGYLIMPDYTSLSIPFFRFGMADYTFTYSLIYPLLIIINDDSSFNGQGLTLMFAMETGLRNNEPLISSSSLKNNEISLGNNLFASEEAKISGRIKVRTINGITGEPVEKVLVGYSCGDESVDLGETRIQEDGNATVINRLPFCIGGLITGYLKDYYASAEALDVIDDSDKNLTLKLWPLKEFKLKVRSKILSKGQEGWYLGENAEGFLDQDDELIYVMKRKALPGEQEFIQTGVLNTTTAMNNPTISLTPGFYDVELYLIRHFGENYTREKFVIPEQTIEVDGEEQKIPAIEFNSTLYLGGLEFTSETGISFNLSTKKYLNSSTITLHYIEVRMSDLTTASDLDQLGKIANYSIKYNQTLMPTMS